MQPPGKLDFERRARRDLRFWLMLAVGIAFSVAGWTVDPRDNCSEDGECAPWLVPVAAVLGLGAVLMGAGALLANVSRGCRYDAATGTLHWWQGRSRKAGQATGGVGGCIALDRVAVVRLASDSDSSTISLYDCNGARLPHFDADVVPWPHEHWVEALIELAPHIRIERAE